MRARGPILAGSAVAVIAVASVLAWPSVADQLVRRIESRLRDETGQSWRIESVGLALQPGPQIVLKNVAVGDDRAGSGVFGARFREVRLTDPVSLVLGSGESGHALAEGASLHAPLAGEPGPAARPPDGKPAPPSPRMSGSFRIAAQGVDGALSESGRALTASAKTLDLVFDRAAPADRAEIRASLEGADIVGTVSIDLPVAGEAAGPFTLRIDPRGSDGHRVAVDAKASLKPAGLRLDAASGRIDGEAFAGDLEIGWGGPTPKVVLNARLDALTLTDEKDAARLDGKPADKAAAKPGLVVPVTPEVVPDVRWFSGFEGAGSLKVGRLALGPIRLSAVDVTATVKGGGLDAALVFASGYEGTARGRYVLARDSGGAGRHQLGVSLKGVRVRPLLWDVAGAGGIDGSGTLRVDLQAKGGQIDEIRHSLSGSADLAVTDGRIDGLDLAGMIGLIPSDQARRGSLGTRLDRLAGSFSLAEGQAVTNDLVLKTALIEASGIGSIDLVGQTLDIRLKPQVVRPDAGRPSGGRNPLDVPVRIVGPWDHPSVSADLTGLANNPSGLIDSLQDLGKGILGGQGGSLGGLGGAQGGAQGGGTPGGVPGGIPGDLGDTIGESLGGLLDGFLGKPQRQPSDRRTVPGPDDPGSSR